nr:ribonuclease H-like domain-containing protein [Tanacetum cinerariifolium]
MKVYKTREEKELEKVITLENKIKVLDDIVYKTEQADWRDETDDKLEDHELKAHYLYMAQIQEVTPDAAGNSGPIFNDEPLKKDDNDDLAKEHREVPVNGTFHEKTDDELTEKELKQAEADDQAIQTILLGLPEDIYAAVDNCESAQEIWLRVQQMMKGSDIGIQKKKAMLFNEWEMFTSTC